MSLKGLEKLAVVQTVEMNGDDILQQIYPQIRGDENKQMRPSDVRVLFRTAAINGQAYQFPNHGHPDNELSTVPFDGENAIVIMPAGETPRQQLFSAMQLVDQLKNSGLARITPEFMEREIINNTMKRQFAAQAYGPAPFIAQAARFVSVDIPSNGGIETIHPDVTDNYAVGMRAPVQEEAFLIIYAGKPADIFIKAGNIAASHLSAMENAVQAKLEGSDTTTEFLDGFGHLAKGIVLAVDAATSSTKPIRLSTAAGIFNLARLPVVMINAEKQVTAQYKPLFPTNP